MMPLNRGCPGALRTPARDLRHLEKRSPRATARRSRLVSVSDIKGHSRKFSSPQGQRKRSGACGRGKAEEDEDQAEQNAGFGDDGLTRAEGGRAFGDHLRHSGVFRVGLGRRATRGSLSSKAPGASTAEATQPLPLDIANSPSATGLGGVNSLISANLHQRYRGEDRFSDPESQRRLRSAMCLLLLSSPRQ